VATFDQKRESSCPPAVTIETDTRLSHLQSGTDASVPWKTELTPVSCWSPLR
jgi:hypothetical protein